MSGKRPVIQCLPVAPVPITRVLYSRAPRTHFTATTNITNEVITSLPISTAPQHPMCLEWTRHCLAVMGHFRSPCWRCKTALSAKTESASV
jgi:hypothetical protein